MITHQFNLQRSRVLIATLVFIYGGAAFCVTILPFKLIIKMLLLIFCCSAFLYQYRQQILFGGNKKGSKAIVALTCTSNGEWSLYNQQQQIMKAQLQKSSVVLPYIAILHFKVDSTSMDTTKASHGFFHSCCHTFFPDCFLVRLSQPLVSLLIFYDAMSAEDFRNLRVCLLTL